MTRDKLEIELIHYTSDGRQVSYIDLAREADYLEEAELDLNSFYGASGGLAIVADGYQIIYRGFDFYVLLRAVDFLLQSLCWIQGIAEVWIDQDDEFEEGVVARFQNGSYLRLAPVGNAVVSLSYQPSGERIERGARFFRDEQFATRDWQRESLAALQEFFNVVEQIVAREPEHPQSGVFRYYLSFWKERLAC